MPRSLSPQFKTNLNLMSGSGYPIILLEIDHDGLTEKVRLAGDNKDVTSGGLSYMSCPFNVSILSDSDKERPKATLEIDNVGRSLTRWVEQTQGGRGVRVTMSVVRSDDPDAVEYKVTLSFNELVVTATKITGSLGFENYYRLQAINKIYSPRSAPGLHNASLDQ